MVKRHWKALVVASIVFLIVLYFIEGYIKHRQSENTTEAPSPSPKVLNVVSQDLVVNGKKKTVFNIVHPNGEAGLRARKGDYFNVILKNNTMVPVSIHWHGMILPNDQDGVPYVTQLPIQPGESKHYYYELKQAGTYWMHSHYKLHEQDLMAAPLIINDDNDPYEFAEDITVMLHDFSFRRSDLILADLKRQQMNNHHQTNHYDSHEDLNDVKYDAMLANRRTLRNPEVYRVKPGQKIRLRMINAASATDFWVYTGKLPTKLIAADGNLVKPFEGDAFQLAVAQRIDLEVTIPSKGGVFPVFAQVEGIKQRAGIVLATAGARVPKFSEYAKTDAPALNDEQEMKLHPYSEGLRWRPIKATLNYKLTGSMNGYIWKINDEVWPAIKPLTVEKGERVAIVYQNDTDMAHPMHLHGHVFQVADINGQALINGPMRDTVLVLPHTTKTILFDANNPGIWMMHCHVLYHMASGMMTTVNYKDYREPRFYKELIRSRLVN